MRVVLFVFLVGLVSRKGVASPEEPLTLWTSSPTSLCLINQNKTTLPFVPANDTSCRADAIALCKPYFVQELNCSFSSPEIVTCLSDNYHLLSPECRDVLPCGSDIENRCSHVHSGANLVLPCLKEAGQNESDPLSAQCVKFSPCLDASSNQECKEYPYDYKPLPKAKQQQSPNPHLPTAHHNAAHVEHDSSHHRILNSDKPAQSNKGDATAQSNNMQSSPIVAKTGAAVRANAHYALFGAVGGFLLRTLAPRIWDSSAR